MLDRPRHGDVEQTESPGVATGDRRRFDHDDGVELQPLCRGGVHHGHPSGHSIAVEQAHVAPLLDESRQPGRCSGATTRPTRNPSPRPAQWPRAGSRQELPCVDVEEPRLPPALADGTGGLHRRRGHGQQLGRQVEDLARGAIAQRQLVMAGGCRGGEVRRISSQLS
jgi:hypothetical protein